MWQAEFTAEYCAKTILPLRPIYANAQRSSVLPRVRSIPRFIAGGLLLHCRRQGGENGRGAGVASKFRKCACPRTCTVRRQLSECARRWRSLEHPHICKDDRQVPQQSAGRDDADVDEDRTGSSASESSLGMSLYWSIAPSHPWSCRQREEWATTDAATRVTRNPRVLVCSVPNTDSEGATIRAQ